MGIYWVMLAIFHVTVLVHSGNSCTLQIESDHDFVLLGQRVHLNCTSDCSEMNWETRLTKESYGNKTHNFISVKVQISDYEDSPITCQVITDDDSIYSDTVRVEAYALPSRVDIDLMEELEEDKEHEVTCSVDNVAPIKNLILSVTRGGEPFLSRTFEEDTRRGPQNLKETFKFTARRSYNLQDFICQATLNLSRVTNTTVQSSPITTRTYAMPEYPHITAEKWMEQGTVTNISCEVLFAFPTENIETQLFVQGFPNTMSNGNVFVLSTLDTSGILPAQYNVVCESQVFNFSKQSNMHVYIYESPNVNLTVSRTVLNLGDMVTINCSLIRGSDTYFGLSIRVDGEEIKRSSSNNLDKNITVTRRKSNFSVICEIFIRENDKVLLKSQEDLNVHYLPEFNNSSCPDSIVWVEGKKTMFGCRSEGNPTPEEQCSFNNRSLKSSTSFTAERNMSGVYRCQASNSVGTDEKLVEVTVQYPPGTPTVHISATLPNSAGGSVSFTCHSDGQPLPTYSWVIPPDAQVEFSKDNRSITITEVLYQHSGKYTCHVKNEHGQSLTQHNLKVQRDNMALRAVLVCVGVIILGAVIIGLLYISRQNRRNGFYDLAIPNSEEIPMTVSAG